MLLTPLATMTIASVATELAQNPLRISLARLPSGSTSVSPFK